MDFFFLPEWMDFIKCVLTVLFSLIIFGFLLASALSFAALRMGIADSALSNESIFPTSFSSRERSKL